MMHFLANLWRKLGLPKDIQLSIMRVVQDEFLVGVTGVILNDKREVLLFKHTYRQVQWSLPGGYIKKGEHPAEGLEREIAEESGFIVSADEELKIRTDRSNARLDIGFTGMFIGGEFKPSHEVSAYGFFTLDTLPLITRSQLVLINSVLKHQPLAVASAVVLKQTFSQKLKNLFTS
jgi:ADP-ribose pyrophosphatase YjhB (NUDIX family)